MYTPVCIRIPKESYYSVVSQHITYFSKGCLVDGYSRSIVCLVFQIVYL